MGGSLSLLMRLQKAFNPTVVAKQDALLQIGILGAAQIAPSAIILPARNHPEVAVAAVACHDKGRGDKFAKANGVPHIYHGSNAYQELLDDSTIDIVYIALPNALHYEWTMKSLKAGKHVLLEKPSANNVEDAKAMFAYAEEKGLVVLEGCHSRFHPAIVRFKSIIDSGKFGKVVSFAGAFRLSKLLGDDDIRFNLSLGGGTLIDLGSYVLALTCYALSSELTGIVQAHADRLSDDPNADTSKIDLRTTATLAFPSDITSSVDADWHKPRYGPFGLLMGMPEASLTCVMEGGEVRLSNYVFPNIWHSLSVTPKGGKKQMEYAYAFEGSPKEQQYWSTYRHQLEAFVDKIKGRQPRNWVTPEESIKIMKWIDKLYENTGLGPRPSTSFVFVK
ncbi:NAD-binding protein [Laetiporus sulphureus 93-53]|uniref:D-xylose 1-dehydrogenase (NADP(+), D-xylono-1,5-lactone-forming) n=1 Tax=Laetiporus sulphureus 93-53 TaxID=1314785 RepID=A0A165C5K0_9APHY|nr:NAD-binding protein [Laetiporus sulphureus 93-53]KZT02244.1 NAD-binding protein [Laetiporus sulphureus 93-53]